MALHLVVPELCDFLMLYGRVVPDEVSRFVLVSGFVESHLPNDDTNWKRKGNYNEHR